MARGKESAKKLRSVLPLGAVTLFSLLLFFWIAPFDDINPLRTVTFTGLVFVFWLAFIGLVLITLGILALPEMKNFPARFAGAFFIGFGLVALVFAVIVMIDGNINTLVDNNNLRFITALLFGVASVILLADLIPRLSIGKGIIQTANG